jgi:hypothetical protein
MSDNDFADSVPQALARLAALQRLREQMTQGNRESSLQSIEQLIEQEMRALREARDKGEALPL